MESYTLKHACFSHCDSNLNPATVDSSDLIKNKQKTKQKPLNQHTKKKETEEQDPLKNYRFQLPQVKYSVKPKPETESTRHFLTPVTFFSHDSMKLSTEIKPIWIGFVSPPHQQTLGVEFKFLCIYWHLLMQLPRMTFIKWKAQQLIY